MRLASPSLFWRTFLLIVALIATSSWVALQIFQLVEQDRYAQQVARELVSIVNTTRSALVYSDPTRRRGLLLELIDAEGIRVVPRETSDQVQAFPPRPLVERTIEYVAARLGPDTLVVAAVNGVPGIWISFSIDDDGYWVYIERNPLDRALGSAWIGWSIAATLLALVVAIAVTRLVNRPLSALSSAARALGAGRNPPPLPEAGPAEIRTVNRSFNRMVSDLDQLARDRAVLLAGISHDLRTPLTRLRLEVEINALPDETRQAMTSDIEQMDAIVAQFLDYARPASAQPPQDVDLSALVADAVTRILAKATDTSTSCAIQPAVHVEGYATELMRAVDNLLTNATRYGRDPDDGQLHVHVELASDSRHATVTVADRGAGIAAHDVDRVLRPFERGDAARSGSTGSGLGLAIVDRVAARHGGSFALMPNLPHGLRARIQLPIARKA
ncbi:MAG TPA: ATP-binding protein [Burkholderiaceae bacterium]|nr:ATP-binding protein [Burkholderiaceae bacterium]